jgi:hypothetical protein
MMAAALADEAAFTFALPKALFPATSNSRQLTIFPDRRWPAVLDAHLTVVTNWTAGIR